MEEKKPNLIFEDFFFYVIILGLLCIQVSNANIVFII